MFRKNKDLIVILWITWRPLGH